MRSIPKLFGQSCFVFRSSRWGARHGFLARLIAPYRRRRRSAPRCGDGWAVSCSLARALSLPLSVALHLWIVRLLTARGDSTLTETPPLSADCTKTSFTRSYLSGSFSPATTASLRVSACRCWRAAAAAAAAAELK